MSARFSTWLLAITSMSICAALGCAPDKCPPSTRSQGVIVQAQPGVVELISGSDACRDVRVRCTPYDFSGEFAVGCERYQVLPRRAGTCTLTIALTNGETVTHAIEIVDRTGDECENVSSFYAKDPADDGFFVSPTR